MSQGLRPFPKETRRPELLEGCLNLRVKNSRLEEAHTLEWPEITGIDPGFPSPQLRFCWSYTFLLEESTISRVYPSDWSTEVLFDGLDEGGIWHVADFGEFVVFTNSVETICWPESFIEAPEFPETAIECFHY